MMNEKEVSLLIVDDQVNNIKVLSSFLNDKYKLFVAQSGERALKVLEKVKPDLILLDVMMPNMDGYELCKIIKEKPDTSDIPVIFLTAKTETEDIVLGFDLGAVDYIIKPFNIKEVNVRINNHLKLSKAYNTISNQKNELEKMLKIVKDSEKQLLDAERKNSALAMAVTANHEMNQPLMVISGNIDILEMKVSQDNSLHKYFTKIRDSISRIDDILHKMRDLSKRENIEFVKYTGGEDMVNLTKDE